MPNRLRFILAPLLAAILAACAQTAEIRKAEEVVLPPYPAAEDLIDFAVSNASSNRFLTDTRSITVDAGGEINLTVVIRSAAGAETVTHEGIHCKTAEYRILAVARRDGSWSRQDAPQWRPIENNSLNRHRAALATEYLCDGATAVRDPKAAIAAMRDRAHLRHGPGDAP